MTYQLGTDLDVAALRRTYEQKGRVQVMGFLAEDGADRLHRFLKGSGEWRLVVNQGDKSFELDRTAQAAMTPDKRDALMGAIHAEARYGFQYLYETIRVPEGAAPGGHDALTQFASFMSSPEVVALMRAITGEAAIHFADAQATAYGLGHFLTAHDDAVAGKNRHAAYVFNLTPSWRPDWGGLLMFHGSNGHVEEGWAPAFNTLNLFAVPQPHSVSMVAPFAAARRYSVTGWLRGTETLQVQRRQGSRSA